jgi:hypothetical protein
MAIPAYIEAGESGDRDNPSEARVSRWRVSRTLNDGVINANWF